jgi:Zn-dependent protease with chaperone function
MFRAPGRVAAAVSIFSTCALFSACAMPPPSPRGAYPSSRRAPISDRELAEESSLLQGRAERHFEEQKARVERVGRRLLETIPSHPNVQFVLVSGDPSINAGATFGQVAITSGMLNFIESDDEMAVVLGHELAHITEGHVMKGTVSGLALNVLAIVLESRVPGAGQAAGGIGQLFLNHYTQNQEREADDVGLRYAYEAGYDPRVAARIQERLAVETPQSMSAGYFDTHPSSVERAVTARRHAEELLAEGDPPGREQVLSHERADLRRERGVAPSGATARPGAEASRGTGRGRADDATVDLDGCHRAEIYVEMAREARDPKQRDELNERARRYCPRLADAKGGSEPGHERLHPRGDDADVPLDKY